MKRRGFSLAECLMVLLLFSLLLGMLGQVTQEYGASFRRMRTRGQEQGALYATLNALRTEMEQSQSVVRPTSGSDTEVVFTLLDPAFEALQQPPYPAPTPWSAAPAANLASLR
ncbi:MAG: prepilin-type N-terminal cleavage/methylation domain-containing protein, partial [Candidatus Eremiobacterota bacterium]